jgi:hypothetical protein
METASIEHVLKEKIISDNPETYKSILTGFCDNPALLFAYADFLYDKMNYRLSKSCYETAAALFLKSERILQAAIAKYYEWRVELPNSIDVDKFFKKLRESNHESNTLNKALNQLSNREIFSLIQGIERFHLPCATIVKKAGKYEVDLFIVLNGKLKESFFHLVSQKSQKKTTSSKILTDNDCFGNIYPFDQDFNSFSTVESITSVELAKLSKAYAAKLCRSFPNVEKVIIKLCEVRSNREHFNSEDKIRMSQRYPIKVPMTLELLPSDNTEPWIILSGYSKNCSISGVGFIVTNCEKNDKDLIISLLKEKKQIRTKSIFHHECISISVNAKIVRYKEVIEDGKKSLLLGTQFEDMLPNLQGTLFSAIKAFSHSSIF